MSNAVIEVKQLPVIEERLQAIKVEIAEKVAYAKTLECTEETLGEIKDIRAAFNKEFKELEERRKEVKKAIMLPYERFEEAYKDCISESYKEANEDLKRKIDSVENELRARKTAKIKAYFDEYLASKNIDLVTFEDAKINVTLSASEKSLKEQAKAFIDRVYDDLILIDTQEHKDEIMYEYKRFLNAHMAITTVATRHKAIEEEKKREEERKAQEEAARAAAEKVASVVETLTPPTVETLVAPVVEEPVLTVKFTVKGTRAQLRALKEYLKNNNYDFE